MAYDHLGLEWDIAKGYGYLPPSQAFDYGENYWHEYLRRDATPVGATLTRARIEMVQRYHVTAVTDFGIGGGRFVRESHTNSVGHDINPLAIQYLQDTGRWTPFYGVGHTAVTFWDVLEHLEDPSMALMWCVRDVFVSLPVFDGPEQAVASKHFKPNEHLWYFTPEGFERYMDEQGFARMATTRIEEKFGREGIQTFAFRRK